MQGVAAKDDASYDLSRARASVTGQTTSGGGIFTLPGVTRLGDVSPPRLVGITIETWPAEDLYVGTRIDLINEAISAAA